jgi:hypothetical protein
MLWAGAGQYFMKYLWRFTKKVIFCLDNGKLFQQTPNLAACTSIKPHFPWQDRNFSGNSQLSSSYNYIEKSQS